MKKPPGHQWTCQSQNLLPFIYHLEHKIALIESIEPPTRCCYHFHALAHAKVHSPSSKGKKNLMRKYDCSPCYSTDVVARLRDSHTTCFPSRTVRSSLWTSFCNHLWLRAHVHRRCSSGMLNERHLTYTVIVHGRSLTPARAHLRI